MSCRPMFACALLVTSLGLGGCGADGRAPSGGSTWDAFEAAATRIFDGRVVYVIDGDVAVSAMELRAYYEEHVAAGGLGTARQPSTVNVVDGHDDIWAGQQYDLRYCVSDEFGADKARAIAEMAQATRDWQSVTNVSFRHLAPQDGSCTGTNANVIFAVRPWDDGGACAFHPSRTGCVDRTLVMDLDDFDNDRTATYDVLSPNLTTVGVFRHELGHILGLRHEHTRPDAGTCVEISDWRAATTYDVTSVMHYPWCNGVITSDLTITGLDAAGARALYGTQNLALGRPASQSSTFTGSASQAVDGNTDGTFSNGSVTHTAHEARPWWRVDLGAVTDVGQVILYSRTDAAGDGLSSFDLQLSDDGKSWQTVVVHRGAAPARSAFSIDRPGRFVRVRLRGTDHLSLAEVQVLPPRNLAAGKAASQSTTRDGGVASRAVDGNTDGDWANGSVTHTEYSSSSWWQVDLGSVTDIGQLVLHGRTDAAGDRLSNFEIQLSDDGADWQSAATFPGTAPARTAFSLQRAARLVRVHPLGTSHLSLAEVEVFPRRNLAAGMPAAQSTTLDGGVASRAVDGNTDGDWAHGSVTRTDSAPLSWWQVDLGRVTGVGQVVLYDRTDAAGERLSNFEIQVSNDGTSWQSAARHPGTAPARTVLSIDQEARFVRVSLLGIQHLSLAEVLVLSPS